MNGLTAAPRPMVRRRRLAAGARAWWPAPALVVASLCAQYVVLERRYDVGGHAAGHLASAGAPFLAAAIAVILVWSTPAARRRLDVLVATVLWVTATVLVLVGNLRVVDDLVDAGHAYTPTGDVPDIADHGLANSSVWYAWLAALLVIALWRLRGIIGTRLTVTAASSPSSCRPGSSPAPGWSSSRSAASSAAPASAAPDRRLTISQYSLDHHSYFVISWGRRSGSSCGGGQVA